MLSSDWRKQESQTARAWGESPGTVGPWDLLFPGLGYFLQDVRPLKRSASILGFLFVLSLLKGKQRVPDKAKKRQAFGQNLFSSGFLLVSLIEKPFLKPLLCFLVFGIFVVSFGRPSCWRPCAKRLGRGFGPLARGSDQQTKMLFFFWCVCVCVCLCF